ncbi:MAG: right-handed parallel beta-helix repeat-containing protein [Myxococcota bacterium]
MRTRALAIFLMLSALCLPAVGCDGGSDGEGDEDAGADTSVADSGGDAAADTTDDTTVGDTTDDAADPDTTEDAGDVSPDASDTGAASDCGPVDPMPASEFDTVYDVGPGEQYESPNEVPWESIGAGTLVRIHHRAEPYAAKWVLAAEGTADKPIVVRGIPSGGDLPVITGDGATTRQELDFWSETRGVIKIGGSSNPSTPDGPSHIHIENLEITGGKAGNNFTDDGGASASFDDNAAGIFIEAGSNIVVKNCEIHGNGNGLFAARASSDVLVAGNYIWGNGNSGSIYEHNSYTESQGITFEYNHYGALCEGCPGNNLKDRSAGTVIRYNWIEDGNRQLDLVDSGHAEVRDSGGYNATMVYGNVLLEGPDEGNSQIVHYGGDSGDEQNYRKGTLYFFHNTVASTRNGNTTLVRLSTDDESAYVHNNILHSTAGSGRLALVDSAGEVDLQYNWLTDGWVESHSGSPTVTVTGSDNLTGAAPGFVDLNGGDYTLAIDSAAIGAAGALDAPAAAPECQYAEHHNGTVRASSEDLGALER